MTREMTQEIIPEALDEWRWRLAARLAGKMADWCPEAASEYRRLVRESVMPPAEPRANTDMETMLYDANCEIERLTAENAALRMKAERSDTD